MYMVQVVGDIIGCQWVGVFGFCFYVMYMMCCGFDIVFFFNFVGFEQNCRDYEGDCYCCDNCGDVSEVGVFWCYCQYCQDRVWGSWGNQIVIEDSQGEDIGYFVEDNGQDQVWVYQYVWEVDFMDIIQEVDDSSFVCRLFCVVVVKEYVCQQNVYFWIWVSFNQEEDGFIQFVGLLNIQW